MTTESNLKINHIYEGDCLGTLRQFPDGCVDMCVTSPPYYALRDYGCEGQIGLEETPESYINRLADVFDEVRRVLKDDGTLWVNIGDSYNGYKGNANSEYFDSDFAGHSGHPTRNSGYGLEAKNLKSKDLIGIPWMLAFELRKRGWYLRQDIIWSKPNPMPESVKDRCTKAHEYIFLLSKSPKYYFDYEAIQEEVCESSIKRIKYDFNTNHPSAGKNGIHVDVMGERFLPRTKNCQAKGQTPNSFHVNREMRGKDAEYFVRNKRSVWHVATKPFKEAHFAVFPEHLIAPCINAGSKEGGIVLDPFMGAGTTAVVCKKLSRKFVGCELNPEYIKIAEKRLFNLGESLFDLD